MRPLASSASLALAAMSRPCAPVTNSSVRSASQRTGLLEVLGRVVADLLQRGEQLEHQACPLDAFLGGDRLHRLPDDRLVQRDLLCGQRHEQVRLGLARQFGRYTRIGLSAAQQERPDQGGEPRGSVGVPVPLDRDRHPAGERLQVPQQPRCRPVEDGPQIRQPVLHRGPGQRDPGRRRECAQFPGGP